MADVSKIKLPNGTTYNIKDNNALPLTGGSVTGPVSFGDSVSIDEATIGDLVVNGSASFTNGAHGVIDKAKAADVTSTLNALVKYEDTEGTFSDSNIYNTSNNLVVGSTSVPGNIQIGAKNDNYGILPNTSNYNQVGSSSLYWYRAYINNYYGLNSHVTNWDAGKNIGTASTSSAAATLGSVYFYNACAAGGTQTKTLLSNGSATSNITVTLPSTTGTLALTSQLPTVPSATGSATTGITIAAHGTGTVIGVQSSTTTVRGVKTGTNSTTTASKVTLGTAISVPNVTGNDDVTVPIRADADTTVPTAASSATTVPIKATSATTVPIKNTSATSIPNVTAVGSGSASLTFTIDTTDTKKLKITFSHTHTAPTLGTEISIIGVQSSTTSVTGVQSSTTSVTGVSGSTTVRGVKTGTNSTTTASKVTLGTAKSIPNVTAATDVTVPIRADADTTVPIKNTSASTFVTGTTHTVTDNGHTHTI